MAAIPAVLLLGLAATNQALAWDGQGWWNGGQGCVNNCRYWIGWSSGYCKDIGKISNGLVDTLVHKQHIKAILKDMI